jgi:hypothetical protein
MNSIECPRSAESMAKARTMGNYCRRRTCRAALKSENVVNAGWFTALKSYARASSMYLNLIPES